jgi:hypothetical protein
MDRRKLGAGLMVFASSLMLLAGSASAHTVAPQAAEGAGSCHIRSLPSFIAQGEFGNAATVADVIEVSCDPFTYSSGAEVTIVAAQLYSRCHELTWYDPNGGGEFKTHSGPSFEIHLDVNGNANVALIAGPKCMVGESLIAVDENESPFETFTTSFQVLPAVNTPAGLFMTPKAQVEDAESSAVITIAQAEFSRASEQHVRLGYEQLADRCEREPGAILIKADREEVPFNEETENAIELDNNGNGFAILAGVDSCAEGESLIESDLESSPFTTQTATFTVEAPRPSRF